jgi:hypothetical protein
LQGIVYEEADSNEYTELTDLDAYSSASSQSTLPNSPMEYFDILIVAVSLQWTKTFNATTVDVHLLFDVLFLVWTATLVHTTVIWAACILFKKALFCGQASYLWKSFSSLQNGSSKILQFFR